MKIIQEFTIDRPRDQIRAFFQDGPAVASRLPGANPFTWSRARLRRGA